jgi:O-antigen ligase
VFFLVVLLSLSYWYCLPVVTQSLFSYNEFRGYDFLMLFLGALLLNSYRGPLRRLLATDRPGQWMYRFCLWATATFPVTIASCVLNGKIKWIFVTLIFLFHLWGFFFGYAAVRLFIQTRRRCFILLDLFLIAGTVVATLICLQSVNALPRFWSSLYDGYGNLTFSATLGPNRTMPGHCMVLLVGVATSYWRNARTVGAWRIALALVAGTVGLAALGVSGSRTAWTTFAVFCVMLVLGSRPNLGGLVYIAAVTGALFLVVPDSVRDRINMMYNYRLASKLERVKSDDPKKELRAIDSGRSDLWQEGLEQLGQRIWLFPFGGGFNNYRYAVEGAGVSAHNMYITIVGELGLLGLFLYLRWLLALWQETSTRAALAVKRARYGAKVFQSFELRSLLVAMMVSLLGGEILYPYRPCFSFLGMFLFVCAVMNHPALVYGKQASPASPAPVSDTGDSYDPTSSTAPGAGTFTGRALAYAMPANTRRSAI